MDEIQEVEEGFYPNKMQLKQTKLTNIGDIQNKNEYVGLFNTFHLPGDIIMKKQPLQSYDLKLNMQISKSEQRERGTIRKKQRFILDHPYNIYTNGSKYLLAYSKTDTYPLGKEFFFAKNDITLFDQQKQKDQKHRLIKEFEITDQTFQKHQLVFDSKFESANLRCAYRRIATNEYHCFLDNDTNTLGYNQWFYFSIKNAKKSTKYSFKILNFKKKHSFYKYGYKPAIFSLKKHQKQKNGWYRDGFNINYAQSPISTSSLFKFYSLSFQIQFDHDDDFIMIATNLPYSYTKLIHKIKRFEQQFQKNKNIDFKMQSICKTLCNNDVPQIKISNKHTKNTKMIIFMARQHPGETVSSYLMERILKYLSQNKKQLQYLLQNYVIVIYPMINIDGVVYGNSRCDISGVDLNRRWRDPSKIFHPQIYQIKKRILYFQKKYQVQSCFDLHGHSKLYNTFCYSCKDNMYTCRILPYIIQSITKVFYFPSCTFGIARGKQTTARATIYRIIKNQNVLTIQCSYYGYKANGKIQYWQLNVFDTLASSILLGLNQFLNKNSKKYLESQSQIKSNLNQFLAFEKHNNQASGSDSDPSADQIDFQTKIKTVFSKKFVVQAKSFIKQKQLNDIHHKPIVFKQDFLEEIQKIHQKKQESHQFINKQKSIKLKKIITRKQRSKQIQNLGKHTPTKSKDFTYLESLDKIKQKRTISYSIKKTYKISTPQKSQRIQVDTPKLTNKARPMFKKNKKVSLLQLSFNQNQVQRQHQLEKLQIQSKSKQIDKHQSYKIQRQDDNLQQFFKKFEKFIPNNMNTKNKVKLSYLEQSIYRDDQTQILNTLMENKKKLDLQKIKREIDQSTCIVERQGKIKKIGAKDQIIDLKKFKDNQKLKVQIKRANQNYNKYLQDQSHIDFK